MKLKLFFLASSMMASFMYAQQPDTIQWQSEWVKMDKNGKLTYTSDEKGNTIPDFSRVGYRHSNVPLPSYVSTDTIYFSDDINDYADIIQKKIDEIGNRKADANGHKGVLFLTPGNYSLSHPILINKSGVVLRGSGAEENGTKLTATWDSRVSIIQVKGCGDINDEAISLCALSGRPAITEISGTRSRIVDSYVPVGSNTFNVENGHKFRKGDKVVLYRPGTKEWIHDLKMDQLNDEKPVVKQWQPKEYDFHFEREVVCVEGNKITIDNPVVMEMSDNYGGGYLYKYTLDSRISEVGVENMSLDCIYTSEWDETHAWIGVEMDYVENAWVRNVTGYHLTYATVSMEVYAKNVTVLNCKYLQPKGGINGGRRYSFNIWGQQNLVMYCMSEDSRHDYVTGARTLGPNVFYNSTAIRALNDIGPHHRWSCGILFDNIMTDGNINVQDRGDWGTGHGWSGVNIVFWKCTAKKACVQKPWVSGTNYCIGLNGEKYDGRHKDRPSGVWEGQNVNNLVPYSLFMAQLKNRLEEINK